MIDTPVGSSTSAGKPGTPEQEAYLDRLVAAGLLVPSGVDGLFGRGRDFEHVIMQFDAFITRRGSDENATVLRFPPLLSHAQYEQTDHVRGFPDLVGCVHSFVGGDAEHAALINAVESGGDWSGFFTASDFVFTPAACYPLYPISTGLLMPEGLTYDVMSYCFRHEPSRDPARMQLFRMREFVRIGAADQVVAFRDKWATRAQAMFSEVGLRAEIVIANDSFFGRAGLLLAANQREQALKLELVIPITSTSKPTACASSNYHQNHFGHLFAIQLPDGTSAHSACIGFGLERIALALFMAHGLSIGAWPDNVRKLLDL